MSTSPNEVRVPEWPWRSRAMRAVLLGLLGLTNLAGLANLLPGPGQSRATALALLVCGNSIVAVTVLLRRAGRERLAGLLVCVGCVGLNTLVMHLGFGLNDAAVIGLPLTVVVSGLLLDRGLFTLVLALSAVSIVSVALEQSRGAIPTPFGQGASPADALSVAVVLAAVALFVRLLVSALRDSLDTLESRAAERGRLVAELETRNAELERFTYTVSHDLKSPLVTIRGYVETIAKDVAQGRLDRVAEPGDRGRMSLDPGHVLVVDDDRGRPRTHLRAVLHDQGRGQGLGPRALRGSRHRHGPRGLDPSRERAGPRSDVLRLPPRSRSRGRGHALPASFSMKSA